MTHEEADQIQELIQQAQALAKMALVVAIREETGPVEGDNLLPLLSATVQACDDAESMALNVQLDVLFGTMRRCTLQEAQFLKGIMVNPKGTYAPK